MDGGVGFVKIAQYQQIKCLYDQTKLEELKRGADLGQIRRLWREVSAEKQVAIELSDLSVAKRAEVEQKERESANQLHILMSEKVEWSK